MSMPLAATSVQIRKRTSPSLKACSKQHMQFWQQLTYKLCDAGSKHSSRCVPVPYMCRIWHMHAQLSAKFSMHLPSKRQLASHPSRGPRQQ